MTGNYHLRARDYDAGTGRFTAPDPLVPDPSAPAVSPYAYADNRPTVMVDPMGLRARRPAPRRSPPPPPRPPARHVPVAAPRPAPRPVPAPPPAPPARPVRPKPAPKPVAGTPRFTG